MDAREKRELASQLFSKGKFVKSAEMYSEYCQADHKDIQARLRMGDAWLKAGNKEKASRAYVWAAEGFAKEGFLPRAIAASKLVLEIAPAHQEVQQMLAQLYARKTTGPGRPAPAKSSPLHTDFHALPVSAPASPKEARAAPVDDQTQANEVAPPELGSQPAGDIYFGPAHSTKEQDSVLHSLVPIEHFSSGPSVALTFEIDEVLEDPKLGTLPHVPVFSDLPPDAFVALFEQSPLKRLGRGERAIVQGDRGEAFYVVCAGALRVFRTEKGYEQQLAKLTEGHFFGEMALLSHEPRIASVEALEDDTQVLEIAAPVLRALSHKFPSVAAAIRKFCRQRMLSNVMNSAPLFAPFNSQDRRELMQKFRSKEYRPGQVVVEENGHSDGLYVVLSGEVQVMMKGAVVAHLREGEVFGEVSMLERKPATARVTVVKNTSLLRLPKADFDVLILTHPQILEHVSELVDSRKPTIELISRHADPKGSMI
jgi:CRP-like cAMP-binding protein